jgi:Ser/Thr protein kinase RdoA (MazF antagonist)
LWADGGAEATIKFYTSGDFGRVRKFHKRFQPPDSVPLSRWIGGSKSHRVLAFSWLPGSPLTIRALRENPSLAALAGRAVAQFHGSAQPWLKPPKRKGVERRLAALAREADFLHGYRGQDTARLARRLGHWLATRQSTAVSLHGDFHATQVIVRNDGGGLIDCDRAHRGGASRDLGNFLAHLEYDELRGKLSGHGSQAIRKALLDGYRAVRPDEYLGDLEGDIAAGLFDLIHAPFRYREPDWPDLGDAVLRRCRELLADAAREKP